ncbi:hypothetical protein [Crocosphaera watsonii]|uniref:hypothetical protein n=1 Tax=Crocosphaera watsonii TaxID=263511 RepID=UPI0009E401DD|nr:hypothetical protein [Crocosphaera watsonii]
MHLGDLEKNLQQKLEQDKHQADQIRQQNLQQFQQNSQHIFKNAENTINIGTGQITKQVLIWSKWVAYLPAATFLLTLVGTLAGSWGMSRYLTNQFQQIQTNKATLNQLKQETWGIELYQTNQGKFIILPPNSPHQTDWKCKGKPCIKL